MRTLATQLKSSPSSLNAVEGRVAQVLQRASVESAILARVEGSSSAQKAVLRVILNSVQGGDDLGRKIVEASAKIPIAIVVDTISKGVAAWEIGVAYEEKDFAKAIAAVGLSLDAFYSGLLLQITYQSLESAKDAGAILVGNRQDCEDLMEGIFNGGAIEAEGKRYTHEQLFERFKSEEQIRSFVFARAQQASVRGLGEAAAKIEGDIAQAKFNKCYPVIVNVWKLRRGRLEAEYESLFDEVANAPLILNYHPNPLRLDPKTTKAVVKVSIEEPPEVAAKMHRMKAIATELTGVYPSLSLFYTWTEGAKSTNSFEQKLYEYDAPGFYTVEVTRHVSSVAYGRKDSVKLDKNAKFTEDIAVIVEGREADGTYEGKLLMTSLRIINELGEATQVDLSQIPISPIPFELLVEGESSTMSISIPGDKIPIDIKDVLLSGQFNAINKAPILSGQFNDVNKGIYMDKINKSFLIVTPSGQDGVKKFEGRMEGRLIGADSAAGNWESYIAHSGSMVIPIDSKGNTKISTELMSFRMAGSWKAKLKTELVQPKPSSTGSDLKSNQKKPSSSVITPKSGKN